MSAKRSKPLIGITGVTTTTPAWTPNSRPQLIEAIIRDYCQVVERAGGVPVGIPGFGSPETVPDLVEHLDGLILAGGMDVHPRFYGEEPLVGIGEMDYHMDLLQIQLAQRAAEVDKPLLGICRGHQLIGVAFGGTLIQDLPRQWENCLDHFQKCQPDVWSHLVRISPGSRLHAIEGTGELWVNSHHHQAVKDPPPDFVVTARAADGVIEALEHPGKRFLLSVQWHPESIALAGDEPAFRLMQALVEAAAAG
ncbi:MAG: gamma-glutamyl-gamma-aminobutyrate hydrolase family protein [Deltaproteobacteria bacterium]|nr:gamma-glutamyl-gamma-aminobutyrate hydrolase family protein [Deltaproteobacteria bacterium]